MTYQEHLKDSYNEGAKDTSIAVAKEMLQNNEPFSKIVQYSKLSSDEIQKLKKELSKQG